jgi:hypothetical protein
MGLPWVRLDSTIASHDKTIRVIGERGGKGAMAVYMFALGWCGAQQTDGFIPRAALPMLHGTPADAKLLEAAELWDADPEGTGWWIRNWDRRQESSAISESKRERARTAGRRSGCVRRGHPAGCTCWQGSNVHPITAGTRSST